MKTVRGGHEAHRYNPEGAQEAPKTKHEAGSDDHSSFEAGDDHPRQALTQVHAPQRRELPSAAEARQLAGSNVDWMLSQPNLSDSVKFFAGTEAHLPELMKRLSVSTLQKHSGAERIRDGLKAQYDATRAQSGGMAVLGSYFGLGKLGKLATLKSRAEKAVKARDKNGARLLNLLDKMSGTRLYSSLGREGVEWYDNQGRKRKEWNTKESIADDAQALLDAGANFIHSNGVAAQQRVEEYISLKRDDNPLIRTLMPQIEEALLNSNALPAGLASLSPSNQRELTQILLEKGGSLDELRKNVGLLKAANINQVRSNRPLVQQFKGVRTTYTSRQERQKLIERFKILNAFRNPEGGTLLGAAAGDFATGKGIDPLFFAEILRNLEPQELDAKDGKGVTAMHVAASYPDDASLRELIKAGANIDVRDDEGKTPSFMAVENGRTESLKALIKAGADIDIKDSRGKSLFSKAVQRWTENKGVPSSEVEALLHAKDASAVLASISPQRKQELAESVLSGNDRSPEKLNVLRAAGLDRVGSFGSFGDTLNESYGRADEAGRKKLAENVVAAQFLKDRDGSTLLHKLVESDTPNLDALTRLLEAGFDPYVKNNDGWSVMDWIMGGTEGGTALSDADQQKLLRASSLGQSRDRDVTQQLIDSKPEPGVLSALAHGSPDELDQVPKGMLENYLDGRKRFDGGETLLHQAVRSENSAFLEKLLAKRPNPNLRDEKGQTALHIAKSLGKEDAYQALLKAGARENVADVEGRTAKEFQRDTSGGWGDYLSRVVDLPQNIDPSSFEGKKPKEIAAELGRRGEDLAQLATAEKQLRSLMVNGRPEVFEQAKAELTKIMAYKAALMEPFGGIQPGVSPLRSMLDRISDHAVDLDDADRVSAFKALRTGGYDVNEPDAKGGTIGHLIGKQGRLYTDPVLQDPVTDTLVSLINSGALDGLDWQKKDTSGKTPLDYATASGNQALLDAINAKLVGG